MPRPAPSRRSRLDERNLPFLEHLEELRQRLLISFLAVAMGCLVGWFLAPKALELLTEPIRQAGFFPHATDSPTVRIVVEEDGTLRLPLAAPPAASPSVEPPAEADLRTTPTLAIAAPVEPPPAPASPLPIFGPTVERIEFARPDGVVLGTMQARSYQGVFYLRPMDPFLVQLKAALILGIVLALPIIFYQFYAFVAPGLLPQERLWAVPVYIAAILLFPVGAAFAYYMLKFALQFFARFTVMDVPMFNDLRAYLSFALTTMLAFGVVFELPLGVILVTRLGIVSVEKLEKKRKFAFLVILIIAALATPTGDPLTLAAMSIPLYALFELSLFVSRLTTPRAVEESEDGPIRNPQVDVGGRTPDR